MITKIAINREWMTCENPQPPVPPEPPPVPGQQPAQSFIPCVPPDARTPPQVRIPFRQPIILTDLYPGVPQIPGKPPLDVAAIACAKVDLLSVSLALDPRFEQVWNLQKLAIGDLMSTMSLAPLERLDLEFRSSQRQVLERSVLDSSESVQSSESSVIDKEAINVTRSSSKTSGWHFDTTGTLTVGYASLNQTIGYSESVTDSNQQAINKVAERTRKSAESLKALHKIEVKGKTETFTENRMTRIVRNPYKDRTLALNVFQLLKHYSVSTALAETRLALVIPINRIAFDAEFVVANADFLRESLLDLSLVDDLQLAIQGAKPDVMASAPSYALARTIAERALHYLFKEPNIFNMPDVAGKNANDPRLSFDASADSDFGKTGLGDALIKAMGTIFLSLGYFYKVWSDPNFKPDVGDNAIRMAVALANDIDTTWKVIFADPTKTPINIFKEAFDESSLSEILRRVPGFLTIVKGMLLPLLDPIKEEKDAAIRQEQARYATARLVNHLNCNLSYYIQRFLRYSWTKTNASSIIQFVREVLLYLEVTGQWLPALIAQDFDIEGAFIDKQEIVVPGIRSLNGEQIASIGSILPDSSAGDLVRIPPVIPPQPAVTDVQVPCDGIHLEVAEGACVLKDVPDPVPLLSGTLELQGLKLVLTT